MFLYSTCVIGLKWDFNIYNKMYIKCILHIFGLVHEIDEDVFVNLFDFIRQFKQNILLVLNTLITIYNVSIAVQI